MDTVKTIIDGHEMEVPARLMPAEKGKAAHTATPWLQHPQYPTCLCTEADPTMSLLTVDTDGYGAFLNPEDCAFAVLASNAHDGLVMARQVEHKACDWLMARLIELDPNFRPTQSPIWAAIEQGSAALAKAGAL